MTLYRVAHFSGTTFEVERNMNKFLEKEVAHLETLHVHPIQVEGGSHYTSGYIVYEPKDEEVF